MKNAAISLLFMAFLLSFTSTAFGENMALSLDGDGDYVVLPLIPQLASYSVSFWFSPSMTWDSSATDRQTIYEATGPQPDTYVQLYDDGRARCRTYITPINNLYTITDKWIAGSWYHVTVTYDSSERIKSIYANGIERSADTLTVDLSLNTENSHSLGWYTVGESQYFNGRIDEVRIWDYARTQEEILVDMHSHLIGTEEGLVAYWNFDDGTANDGTVNGYDGTLMGDAVITETNVIDIDYSFLSLDGDSDYVILPQIPQLTSYSISLIFSPFMTWDSSAVDRQVLYEATGTDPDTYIQLNDDGRIRYRSWGAGINNLYTTTDKWIADAWYHISVTYDSISHIKSIYANGIEQSADTMASDQVLNTDGSHTIGRYTAGESQYFNGQIDEVRIWNYARTQEEILVDMHSVLTGTEEGLVAYWNFDDGTANDVTSNGYNGTLMGDAVIIIESPPVDVDDDLSAIPNQCILDQNYPNPFNPSTEIRYTLGKGSRVKIVVYDILGKEITTLVNDRFNAGEHAVQWNTENIASGIYIYQLITENFVQAKKMMLVK